MWPPVISRSDVARREEKQHDDLHTTLYVVSFFRSCRVLRSASTGMVDRLL
jgi:hypothetical protein